MDLYREGGKRFLDVLMSSIALLVLLPVFIAVALIVKIAGVKGPVFFTQVRIGRDRQPFKLYKFRSMVQDASSLGSGVTSSRDKRITGIGRILRKTKLDELPQLLNVLLGDMSIVGPRPEIETFIDKYPDDYTVILQVKQGLTDYATLKYRNEEEILSQYEDAEEAYVRLILPDKISLGKKYIEEMGFILDMKIIIKSVVEVIRV